MKSTKEKSKIYQLCEKIYDFVKQKATPFSLVERNVPYLNKPINDAAADEIGMDVYVDYLESAIEQGASMIAIVSRFGTGKSSLIQLLKKKYSGFYKKDGRKKRREYCQINLWSHLNQQTEETDGKVAKSTTELHRIFLYQIISALQQKKSSYFSKRTSRNFGMLRLSAENTLGGVWFGIAVMAIALAALCQKFTSELTAVGWITEQGLSLVTLVGYGAGIVIVIFVMLRTEILFSSKNSEGNRQIEENELIELYREYVLVPKKWYKWLWEKICGAKQIVVVIEDLDRTDEGDCVYTFLKELRKYYIPSDLAEKNFMNQIVFVVNIMPEDLLRQKCGSAMEDKEYVYDKLFDYSLNLGRINIDNFDAILEALILERKDELQKIGLEVAEEDNIHQIAGMQWIVLGKELNLRQVKARLNDAILLYENLRKKFGEEYPEFTKCAVVAYLRNAYSEEFYRLADHELEEMLDWYARGVGGEETFIEDFGVEKSKGFLKEIFNMIVSHLIDGNYRVYFFNYPKDSHLYTVQESKVRNVIVYDEKVDDELRQQISQVWINNSTVIKDAITTVLELSKTLPNVTGNCEEVWKAALELDEEAVGRFLVKTFSNVNEWDEVHFHLLDCMVSFTDGKELIGSALLLNRAENICLIREYLLDKLGDRIVDFSVLFQKGKAFNNDEWEKIQMLPLHTIMKLFPEKIIDMEDDLIDKISERIVNEKSDEMVIEAESFYLELSDEFKTTEIEKQLYEYMKRRKVLIPKLESEIYDAVLQNRINEDEYYILLNEMPIEQIEKVQMERIHQLNSPGKISLTICKKFKEEGMLSDYMKNMVLLDENRLDMTWEEVYAVMMEEGEAIWKQSQEIFEKIRIWICRKYKNVASQLNIFFKKPYPLITEKELNQFSLLDAGLKVYDKERVAEDSQSVFVQFCNRQYRPSNEAFEIFNYISGMEEDEISNIFYKLDMRKVKFSGMSKAKKSIVVQIMTLPLKLSEPDEMVHFMDFTDCLIPELERNLTEELKSEDNKALAEDYLKVCNRMAKVNPETMKNIQSIPLFYEYSDVINQELFNRKRYVAYVCSKTHRQGKFLVEHDKKDVLWSTYITIMKTEDGYKYTRPLMYHNFEFLGMIQDRGDYKEFPENSRMAMSAIMQNEKNLEDVLSYGEDFAVKYYCQMAGFQSKQSAEVFINIMKKYPQYAQNKKIYEAVHGKLVDGNLKRAYTYLYKKANG